MLVVFVFISLPELGQGKNGNEALGKSIADAGAKMPQVTADIEAGESELKQLKADLKSHETDRAAAKTAMAEATSIREKEAGVFAALKSEADANIAAATKATVACRAPHLVIRR